MSTVAEARATTRRVARTFALACRLLPRAVRDDVYLLYLVFRTLDDLVDEGHPVAEERVAAVEAWAAGEPAGSPEARILDALAARHPLPRAPFADFCAGMRDDLEGAQFATEADVDRYCYRVAGTVGLVMAALLGSEEGSAPAAIALGMAMQRTNILRDVDEDAARGRVYLAQEALARHAEPAALLRDQIARADALYERGLAGVGELRRGRLAVTAAGSIYREILRELERGRAVVPRRRKLRLALRSALP